MANPEHLKILKQGAEQWNRWRREHPEVEPELSGADLRKADVGGADLGKATLLGATFRGANLHRADLRRAKLKKADLRGADLSNADLSLTNLRSGDLREANLMATNFRMADLTEARLGKANLRYATLFAANLANANLDGADCEAADFSRADLRSTRLRNARLVMAKLNAAKLRAADFTGARSFDTNFANVDLSTANGLEAMVHEGPSTIGIDTISKSRGKIPEIFLRGCGLADWEIEEARLYDRSLSAAATTDIADRVVHLRNSQPFEYFSCFISYSTRDQEFADRLYADLQAKGVRCWFASHDIKGGRKLHEQLDEAIRLHDRLLLILSEHSMSSNWVKTEIANARGREKGEGKQLLFPITLVPFEAIKQWKLFDADIGIDSAREIREYFIPDFSNWKDHDSYQAAVQRLVSDLKAEASK